MFLLSLFIPSPSVCAGQRYISIYCRQQQHGHSPRGRRGRGQLKVAQQRQPTLRPPPRPAAAGRPAARPRQPATGIGISAMAPSWLRNLRTSKVACVCVRARLCLCESWPPMSDKSARSSRKKSKKKNSAQLLANSFSARYIRASIKFHSCHLVYNIPRPPFHATRPTRSAWSMSYSKLTKDSRKLKWKPKIIVRKTQM